MIYISEEITIDESKIKYQGIRSSGPGGQHINKVSTAIQLKFDLKPFEYPDLFLSKLKSNAGSLLSKNMVITIKAMTYRSQSLNKKDALERLIELFTESSKRPKPRYATKPTKSSIEKRIQHKKNISQKKKLRKPPSIDE